MTWTACRQTSPISSGPLDLCNHLDFQEKIKLFYLLCHVSSSSYLKTSFDIKPSNHRTVDNRNKLFELSRLV